MHSLLLSLPLTSPSLCSTPTHPPSPLTLPSLPSSPLPSYSPFLPLHPSPSHTVQIPQIVLLPQQKHHAVMPVPPTWMNLPKRKYLGATGAGMNLLHDECLADRTHWYGGWFVDNHQLLVHMDDAQRLGSHWRLVAMHPMTDEVIVRNDGMHIRIYTIHCKIGL